MKNAAQQFRETFNKVRREISKNSGFGFGFGGKDCLLKAFRVAMTEAEVPSTPSRIALVNNWVNRASGLGGAV